MLAEAGVQVVPPLPSVSEMPAWRRLPLPLAPIWSPVTIPDADLIQLPARVRVGTVLKELT
ncbi:hypothetical protein [Allorhizocola rhizosphaerae]|uniref:hypothetical protein n=1 Tax=Allorhizocola rhizosphaerae TaxID=1872709 RepID=UPI000E3BA739|nr:hypothetical protein [Allorhizocola rhizosphaerae]